MLTINFGKNKKGKAKTSNKILIAAVIAVIGYTIAAFVLQYMGQYEISATLTGCWFGFWTTEIVVLATIKNTKTKKKPCDVKDEDVIGLDEKPIEK